MADNENYDFNDFEDDDYASGTDLVKKLRKQIDGLQKQLKERDNIIEEFTAYSHEAEVGAILEEFGLSAGIAKYIPSDIEADPDSIAEWLNEYGEDFGITAVDESAPELDADAQAYEQMTEFEDGGYDPMIGLDLVSRVDASTSQDELLNILRGQ